MVRGKVESEKVDKAFNIGSFSGTVVKQGSGIRLDLL